MLNLALATCVEVPNLFKHEQQLIPYLQKSGILVHTPIWNDDKIDWSVFEAVFIRSTWDYHLHPNSFKNWLLELKAKKVAVFNSVDIQLQNMHKFYLKLLQEKGIPIVPTAFIPSNETIELAQLFKKWETEKLIIKPAQSAGAYLTTLWDKAFLTEAQETINKLNPNHDLLIQPFQKAVKTEGEWSLMFFHNRFSHAVLKKTAHGDFRVQEEFGGQYHLIKPETWVIQAAKQVLSAFSEQPLPYARVDGIISENQFLLMELELIEPELFLFDEALVARFGEAILDSLP